MLESIRVPIFMVATEADHVAPGNRPQGERAHDLAGVHFLLTSGGHNVGIVSGPDHLKRRNRVRTLRGGERRCPRTSVSRPPRPNRVRGGQPGRSAQGPLLYGSCRAAGVGAPAEHYKPLGDAPGDYVRLRGPATDVTCSSSVRRNRSHRHGRSTAAGDPRRSSSASRCRPC